MASDRGVVQKPGAMRVKPFSPWRSTSCRAKPSRAAWPASVVRSGAVRPAHSRPMRNHAPSAVAMLCSDAWKA